MAISTIEFAELWQRWVQDQAFKDTSPSAFAEHLEAQHAVQQVAAIKRGLEQDNIDFSEIEDILNTEYGDDWVNTFLVPIPDVEPEAEWPSEDSPVNDDPDYVID